MVRYWKLHKFPLLITLSCLLLYIGFAHDLERTDFIKLITLNIGLFFLSFKLLQLEKWNFKFLFLAGLCFRFVFFPAIPNLSQDLYRFIWDGELILQGIDPYLFTPDNLIQQGVAIPNAGELHKGMGTLSAQHYSNYPPLNQLLFALAALFSGKGSIGAVIAMRCMIIAADIGILYMGRKLLKQLNLPPHLIFGYFLNPLVIVELTGNLHFEGIMLFFFITAIYYISKNKWLWGAVLYALSILVKLVPLIFLPLFLRYYGFKKSAFFYIVVGLVVLLSLLPFFSPDFVDHYMETLSLWFSNFEFNASIYNVVKGVGSIFDLKDYEIIRLFGRWIPYLLLLMVLLFSFLRSNKNISGVLLSMLWILGSYYFISTTVHPWYIIFLVLLSVYTPFRFPLVWSFTAMLSYWAYSHPYFKENLWILALEYIPVYGFLFYELWSLNNKKVLFCKN